MKYEGLHDLLSVCDVHCITCLIFNSLKLYDQNVAVALSVRELMASFPEDVNSPVSKVTFRFIAWCSSLSVVNKHCTAQHCFVRPEW